MSDHGDGGDGDEGGGWENEDEFYDTYDEFGDDNDEYEMGLSADDAEALMALIDEYGSGEDQGLEITITLDDGGTMSVFVPWEMAWDVYDLINELEVDFDYEVIS